MSNDTRPRAERMWHDSARASLCALGAHLQQLAFFHPLEERVRIKQQALKDTPGQQVLMVFVSLLAGAKAVCHADTTVRLAPALQRAFGLPGGAEQSVLADTLNAATERDVADLRAAVDALFRQHSRARRHDCAREPLVLDVDLSPLPASARAAGAERAYLGRCRSETGRTLVRVRAAPYQETVWEAGRAGRTAERLPVVQAAVAQAERLLGLEGDAEEARARRGRAAIRPDRSWGSTAAIDGLLARGDQVTTTCKAPSRVKKLARGIAAVPEPVALARPTRPYAVRTPAAEQPAGYHYAVPVTSRADLGPRASVDHDDRRAGMEADLKSDKSASWRRSRSSCCWGNWRPTCCSGPGAGSPPRRPGLRGSASCAWCARSGRCRGGSSSRQAGCAACACGPNTPAPATSAAACAACCRQIKRRRFGATYWQLATAPPRRRCRSLGRRAEPRPHPAPPRARRWTARPAAPHPPYRFPRRVPRGAGVARGVPA